MDQSSVIINSVDRALDMLLYLHQKRTECSITSISQDLGIYKSTAYRTLVTLENRGFVEQNPETGRYTLGRSLFVLGLGMGDRVGLQKLVKPFTRRLQQQFCEAVNVSVLDQTHHSAYQSVIIWQEEGNQIIHFNWSIGSRNDCYCAGVGKCLLAFHQDLDLSIYETYPMIQYTNNTICTIEGLKKELERVRKQGYALDDEERELGLTCVAAPILCKGEAIAAISISGPTSRMKSQHSIEELASALIDVCNQISQELL